MGAPARWTRERGALWALDLAGAALRPPPAPTLKDARGPVRFAEVHADDATALATAMGLADPAPIRARFASGRRCFVARLADLPDGEPAAYGWVSYGQEDVGELERTFRMREDEVYIWNCATRPAYQGQGLYSALLGYMLTRLQSEGAPRVWIGASRDNRPSVKGIENAGFQPVLKLVYIRLFHLHGVWVTPVPGAPRGLYAAARRMVLSGRERALGPLAIGIG